MFLNKSYRRRLAGDRAANETSLLSRGIAKRRSGPVGLSCNKILATSLKYVGTEVDDGGFEQTRWKVMVTIEPLLNSAISTVEFDMNAV